MLWRSGLLFLLLTLLSGCKEETLAPGEIAPALAGRKHGVMKEYPHMNG